MAAPIGPGDWVECIDPDWAIGGAVRLGGIYCVEILHQDADPCLECGDSVGFELQGVLRDAEWCWCAHQFRPIYRPKADLIESLKVPPERVCEPA